MLSDVDDDKMVMKMDGEHKNTTVKCNTVQITQEINAAENG